MLAPETTETLTPLALHETLVIDGTPYTLDRRALDIRLYPVPTWIYQVNGIEIEKRVIIARGQATVIEYELFAIDHDPLPECTLEVRTPKLRRFDLSRCTRAAVILTPEAE